MVFGGTSKKSTHKKNEKQNWYCQAWKRRDKIAFDSPKNLLKQVYIHFDHINSIFHHPFLSWSSSSSSSSVWLLHVHSKIYWNLIFMFLYFEWIFLVLNIFFWLENVKKNLIVSFLVWVEVNVKWRCSIERRGYYRIWIGLNINASERNK